MLAGIPGIWFAIWFSSPTIREKPLADFLALAASATPILLPLYAIGTLLYGSLVWIVLKSTGQMNIFAFLAASILPVVCYWLWAVTMHGWEPRALWALGAFAIPALCIGAALWWFTA